ncbi:non-ribosomal peptide synthetase [Chryseolinea lacunae]|uniref:Amino acid adenylation domain-containing protein n=1 Tax=Chryseolinea lacunae TaxID=2801331 RepID=A0ABS1KUM5_9BACT|nr:non-ribosomal peptide synthetase [Chryseolinea lacunae]MBL0743074.1 amino acid adenylation domain-containing protein [Chryseolinea lacunae]
MQDDKRNKIIDDYWLNKFSAVAQTGNVVRGETQSVSLRLEATTLANFRALTKERDVEGFLVLATVFQVLLRKYFSDDEFLIATPGPRSARTESANDTLLFLFSAFDETQTLKAIIQKTQAELQQALNHSSYRYENLRNSFADRGIEEADILRYGFAYATAENASAAPQASGFNLLVTTDIEHHVVLRLQFNELLYPLFTAAQFLGHFGNVLARIRQHMDASFESISLLRDDEAECVKTVFNRETSANEGSLSVVDMFSAQAAREPSAVAVRTASKAYTFREIDERSDRLAKYLIQKSNVGRDRTIGVLATKSEWAIIGILGILKSGSAFVPIEPSQPIERIQHMVKDAALEILLVESDQMFDFGWFEGELLVSDIQIDTFENNNDQQLPSRPPDSLAYVIYTSGTTGRPKGVMIEDRSVVNYSSWFIDTFNIVPTDSSIVLSSLAFDLGYTSFWGTLLAGGTLHLVDLDYGAVPDRLLNYIVEQRISFIKTTPSLFYMLTHVPDFKKVAAQMSLRLIVLGGELIRKEDVENYRTFCPDTRFVNHYGPTEATVGCIANPLTGDIIDDYTKAPIIGRPIRNTEVFILDSRGKLAPIGIDGELCIGGRGLARGYLNNREVTDAKFMTHPFKAGERLYKTGDYGRWTEDGKVIIRGRRDRQIKIRGHRVELGEIEEALRNSPSIQECVVTTSVFANGDNKIVAYYTSTERIDEKAIRGAMANQLPAHMIPEYFLYIHTMPLTANGKVDARKLPSPKDLIRSTNAGLLLPRNETELLIRKVWSEVLGREDIGVNDSFFSLGGNSLYLIKVSAMLSESFPELNIIDLFNHTTIEKLATFISSNEEAVAIKISDAVVLLPQLYFPDDTADEQATSNFKFEIRDGLLADLKNVAAAEQIAVWDILKAALAYTLYEFSGQKDICLQSLQVDGHSKNLLVSHRFDFDAIESPGDLFRQLASQPGQQPIDLAKTASITFENHENGIVPFIYRRDSAQGHALPLNSFDFVVEVDDRDADSVACNIEYNPRLDAAAVEELVNFYFGFLSDVAGVGVPDVQTK